MTFTKKEAKRAWGKWNRPVGSTLFMTSRELEAALQHATQVGQTTVVLNALLRDLELARKREGK